MEGQSITSYPGHYQASLKVTELAAPIQTPGWREGSSEWSVLSKNAGQDLAMLQGQISWH